MSIAITSVALLLVSSGLVTAGSSQQSAPAERVDAAPVLTGSAWSAEPDQALASFGASVASAGDVNGDGYSDLIVGAPMYDDGERDEGAAFVYLGSASGLALTPAWSAEVDQTGAHFASSVATAGDVNGDGFSDVIVGASHFDDGETDEGLAFVYLGSPSGLGSTPAWTASIDSAGARFASSVATAGDVNGDGFSDVIIGAPGFSNGESGEGAAFVYLGSPLGLASTPVWAVESDQSAAAFGHSVACAGDVDGDGFFDVIVGAPDYSNGEAGEGRAFVYEGSALGPSSTPAWSAEIDEAGAEFAFHVSTAGDVNADGFCDVIVGAPSVDTAFANGGAAFVYLGSAAGLAAFPSWSAFRDQLDAEFGHSVATAGDVDGDGFGDVIVGVHRATDGASEEGSASLFLGSASGVSFTDVWNTAGGQAGATLGASVAVAGDVNGDGFGDLAIGAPGYDGGELDEGRVLVHLGPSSDLPASTPTILEMNQPHAHFGRSVAFAGDVDGDGYTDLLVAAPQYDNGATDEGAVWLYAGGPAGLSSTPVWSVEGGTEDAFVGSFTGSAGDVNGDGYDDVFVDDAEAHVRVHHGSATGLALAPTWTSPIANMSSAARAGDVNGDGFGDLIAGQALYSSGHPNEGRAMVYLGSASGLASTPVWTVEGNATLALMGNAVSTAGDVNGDGFSDVIVSPWNFASVYRGSPSGPTGPPWSMFAFQTDSSFGSDLAPAGDVNGDGFGDVIVGASAWDNGEASEGRAYVWHGSATGLGGYAWVIESNQTSAFLGSSVSSAGDVNRDGFSDVLVGAVGYDNGQSSEGRATIYFGSGSGLSTSAGWTMETNLANSGLGASAAGGGDVNGDGFSDIVLGASAYTHGSPSEGGVFVHLGHEGRGGRTRALQQRQPNDSRPIALLGASSIPGRFRVSLELDRGLSTFTWASAQRPVARMEWEVARFHGQLDGSAIESGPAQLVTTAPVSFSELVEPGAGLDRPVWQGRANQYGDRGLFIWRARIRTNNPLAPVTPWVSMPGNHVTEAKLRLPAVRSRSIGER